MYLSILNAGLFSFTSPIPYLLVVISIVLIITLKVVVEANGILKEVGSSLHINPFGDYGGLMKWTSQNQKMVGVIMAIIVLTFAIWAINY